MTIAEDGAGTSGERAERGRTTVAARALNRVTCAVAADALGVSIRAVRVDLSDAGGLLALIIRTPVRVATLAQVRGNPHVINRGGGTLIQRAAHAEETVHRQVTALTGAEIAHVTVQLTGTDIQEEKRVR